LPDYSDDDALRVAGSGAQVHELIERPEVVELMEQTVFGLSRGLALPATGLA